MEMIDIDFNDEIYRQTGIHVGSAAFQEESFTAEDGSEYVLQATKRTSASGEETVYISLKTSDGRIVEDLQIRIGERTYRFDPEKSREAVCIEDLGKSTFREMVLASEKENVEIDLCIFKEAHPGVEPVSRARLESFFRNMPVQRTESCPSPDLVAAYGVGELEGEEEERIRFHVHRCRHCLELALEMRAFEAVKDTIRVDGEKLDAIHKAFLKQHGDGDEIVPGDLPDIPLAALEIFKKFKESAMQWISGTVAFVFLPPAHARLSIEGDVEGPGKAPVPPEADKTPPMENTRSAKLVADGDRLVLLDPASPVEGLEQLWKYMKGEKFYYAAVVVFEDGSSDTFPAKRMSKLKKPVSIAIKGKPVRGILLFISHDKDIVEARLACGEPKKEQARNMVQIFLFPEEDS